MKTLVALYAGDVTDYAFSPVFDSKSAFSLSIESSLKVPDAEKVVVLCKKDNTEKCSSTVNNEKVVFIEKDHFTAKSLLDELSALSEGFDNVVFGFADCPFYDDNLIKELYRTHVRYAAEYTFADGYPFGLVPEIINTGALNIVRNLFSGHDDKEITRDVLFSILKTDINSFEIETMLSEKDLRYLRLDLCCDTKRNLLQCERLFRHKKVNANIFNDIEKLEDVLRTLPAFYSIQIARECSSLCIYCPYCQKKEDLSALPLFMDFDLFKKLIDGIKSFSDDAVISLSLWGEAFKHPSLLKMIEYILSYDSLSVLIETSGVELSEDSVIKIKNIVDGSKKRVNHQNPVNFIVSIDATDEKMYRELHGTDCFKDVVSNVQMLYSYFPSSTYPQFVRLKQNEAQMEEFYRFWKEKTSNLIIQKYDSFSESLPDYKVVDLTPVKRFACWHLRRDMNILVNGDVPVCREYIFSNIIGNVFKDSLESIWNKGEAVFRDHVASEFNDLCKACDEYYTFNF